jgi:pilus assembly protein CpaE
VLVVSSSGDGSLVLQALRAGAKEFLSQPLRIDDVLGALRRIGERRFGCGGDNRPRSSQVIAVAGANGGVGTTSLAVNLGCMLARNPQYSVALVDLDLCLGDADLFLDAISDYTLLDVAQNVTRLDFTLLKRSLLKHSSGLYLLPRPVRLEDIPLITPDDLQRAIGLLKATFTYLVLDLSKGYTAIDLIALKMANHILLATQLDLSCLRNVGRLMRSFGSMDGLADRVKIVANRVGLENGQITLKKAEETIGKKIYWQLPNDYRTMVGARNNGVPLIENAPRAAIAQSLLALAKALLGDGTTHAADAGAKQGFGRLFKLWPSKRGK